MQDNTHKINLDNFPVGMGYVPWQKLCTIYENLEQAYKIGTIFPELDKPFTGRRKQK
ncbi:MAG: spore coat associated protein CotJA [Lachnospiraceae bacterium]|nr:spore coat associated protein CotJA [Lachnospiraceae bacterium]